jgi:hypothetical protein
VFRWLTLIPLSLLFAGCRSSARGSGEASPRALKVGPSIERLVHQLHSPDLTPAQKSAYWEAEKGTLVSAKGQVVALSARLVLECPVEKLGTAVFVAAYPDETSAGALSSLQKGWTIKVQGELGGTAPDLAQLGTAESPFVLRNARIRFR